MPERTCSVATCVQVATSRGWCKRHYDKWYLHGDPEWEAPKRRPDCSIPGCGKPNESRDWCSMHYARWKVYGDPLYPVRPTRRPLAERFWEKVDTSAGPDGCWLWTGGRIGMGYGTIMSGGQNGGRRLFAHRVSLELSGVELGDLCALHRCDNPPCVNPAHLFVGTRTDNSADKVAKGRQSRTCGERVGTAKVSDQEAQDIARRFAAGERAVLLAEEYGVERSSIYGIVRRAKRDGLDTTEEHDRG